MSVSFTSSPLNAERVVCELSCEPARFLPPVAFERDFEGLSSVFVAFEVPLPFFLPRLL